MEKKEWNQIKNQGRMSTFQFHSGRFYYTTTKLKSQISTLFKNPLIAALNFG